MWKNINRWKIRPLTLWLRPWQIHKQILLYSWKMVLCGFVSWNWNLEVFLICGNPHPQFSSTTQFSLCFYRILEKNGGGSRWHFNNSSLKGGLNAFRQGPLGSSAWLLALRQPSTMTWTLSKSKPRGCLIFQLSSLSLLVKFGWAYFSLMEKLFD